MRSTTLALLLVCSLGVAACGGDDDVTPMPDAGGDVPLGFQGPDDYCPGSAHCTGAGGDGKLYVGVGAESIAPTIAETWTDTNGDSEWQKTEPYVDANGNGKFDAYWIAGFGSGRAANGISDDIQARAIAFRWHDITYVILVEDVVGFLGDNLQQIRDDPQLASLEIDHIQIGSTHTHESVDTIGIWGENELKSGYNPDYMQYLRDQSVKAIKKAVTDMKAANMTIAQAKVLDDPLDPSAGTDDWNHDIRDPIVYDPTMTVVRFSEETDDTKTIATLINWASHPEYGGDENLLLSADYPHWFRETVEQGIAAEGLAGLGGTAVFVQGPLGGQVGALHGVNVPVAGGMPIGNLGIPKAQAVGVNLGRFALNLLADAGVVAMDHSLNYRTAEVFAAVDNIGFQTYFLLDILAPHELVGYDPTKPVEGDNIPYIPLRITWFQIGPLGMPTAPGELHPELWVGMHTDGSWSFGYPILDPAITENVPILTDAPQAPYLRDLALMNPGVQYTFLAGCMEDYIGYIVPSYNYVLHPSNPYIEEAAGQHYEETRSLGPDEEDQLVHPILDLVKWRPGN